MFKRSLQVSVVKTPDTNTAIDSTPETINVDYTQIGVITEKIFAGVILAVGSYVVLDTVRQVLVKATPQH